MTKLMPMPMMVPVLLRCRWWVGEHQVADSETAKRKREMMAKFAVGQSVPKLPVFDLKSA